MNWGTHILGPLGNLHWVDPMGSDWQSTFSEIKQVVLQFQQTKSNEPVFNVTVMPVNIAQEAHNCSGTKTGGNWKRIFSTRKAVFTCFYLVVACGRQIDEFGFFCCISVSHHFSPKHETSRNAIIIPGWRTGLNWRHAIWQKLHQFHLHLPPVYGVPLNFMVGWT